MKSIISIQSHFVSGHVANSSAVFPMQKMGVEVWPIHSAQISSITERKNSSSEQSRGAKEIHARMDGLKDTGKLVDCGAILAGYQGSGLQHQAIVDAVKLVKECNPEALFIYEPEFQIDENSLDSSIKALDVITQTLIPMSDAVILSERELSELTQLNVESLDEAVTSCEKVLKTGAKMAIVKGLDWLEADTYSLLLTTRYASFIASLPKINFDEKVRGIGNLFSALFTAGLVRNILPLESFRHALNAAYGVLEITNEQGKYELQIIDAQYEFVEPTHEFEVIKVK
ncbi:pyridoxal kinase [Vibrio sp. Sgm 22]|uniref:pyridoxal kinase n=1 Tax=unclassified Vibrio TaxID=2614977 RepID=UPI002248C93B|nr:MULTISPECIES: pyridoxal kinase [unclassified Vibrio]MCX2760466.1 pyridoxal kinase [Vibrio sp. 14G-20]MCX2777490.1 pyridoxal kinase [Vibrio sp. Sgm 22]